MIVAVLSQLLILGILVLAMMAYFNNKHSKSNKKTKGPMGAFMNDSGEVNVYSVIMAVLMLTVGVSLVAMFNGIFPAVTGNVILQQNVTTANPMYPVVSAVPANAQSWYSLNSTTMTIGIVAVLASIALGIFAVGRSG